MHLLSFAISSGGGGGGDIPRINQSLNNYWVSRRSGHYILYKLSRVFFIGGGGGGGGGGGMHNQCTCFFFSISARYVN